jgi:chitinase
VGQHASWDFFTRAVDHWLTNKQLPKEKLVAGVPFYAYLFQSSTSAANAEGVAYRDILTRYPNQDAHLKDNVGLAYYNGIPTIQRKAQYIVDKELGGIMIWEISQDSSNADVSLLHAIDAVVKAAQR